MMPTSSLFFGNDRVTGEAVARGQLFHFLQRGGRGNGLRSVTTPLSCFFTRLTSSAWRSDGHVFVDEAQAAFLRQRDGQPIRSRYPWLRTA